MSSPLNSWKIRNCAILSNGYHCERCFARIAPSKAKAKSQADSLPSLSTSFVLIRSTRLKLCWNLVFVVCIGKKHHWVKKVDLPLNDHKLAKMQKQKCGNWVLGVIHVNKKHKSSRVSSNKKCEISQAQFSSIALFDNRAGRKTVCRANLDIFLKSAGLPNGLWFGTTKKKSMKRPSNLEASWTRKKARWTTEISWRMCFPSKKTGGK